MKTYRVGGCVRDRLLEIPVSDIDWVVTGATVEAMKAAGFKSIGKNFPVFLHPESRQEYALARCERKTAPGYHGFEFVTDPTITIEQDLSRRDLTINSMVRLRSRPVARNTGERYRLGRDRRHGGGYESRWI